MLRSLLAAILAVLIGLASAQLIERAGVRLFADAGAAGEAMSFAHQLVLIASWGVGAFIAASLALLIGRRWAPLGWLSAASILLLAVVSAASAPGALMLTAGAALAAFGAGLAAVRALRATNARPATAQKPGMF